MDHFSRAQPGHSSRAAKQTRVSEKRRGILAETERAERRGRPVEATEAVGRGRDGEAVVSAPDEGYFGHVKEARISEIKNHLSRYLALVRRGEVVRILDRDRPVAQIVPIGHAAGGRVVGGEALAEMERKGLVRRGSGRIAPEILSKDPPGRPCGVLAALLEEREGR